MSSPLVIETLTNSHYDPKAEQTEKEDATQDITPDKKETQENCSKPDSESSPATTVQSQPDAQLGKSERLVSDEMIKMAQARLALLQRQALSPSMLKPTNLVRLASSPIH